MKKKIGFTLFSASFVLTAFLAADSFTDVRDAIVPDKNNTYMAERDAIVPDVQKPLLVEREAIVPDSEKKIKI